LTAAWDQFSENDPELEQAYDWPDFPSDRTGEGNWIDLYLTDSDEFPVGRLWINPETENVGLEELKWGNTDHLTRIALQLRDCHHRGLSPLEAFEYVKGEYCCGAMQTGSLADTQARNQD
jgi:hypothetical protein